MRCLLFCLLFFALSLTAQDPAELAPVHPLDNPFTEQGIQELLLLDRPQLLFREGELMTLRQQVMEDPFLKLAYAGLLHHAEEILTLPMLTRKMTGRRLLSVSRESLRRNGLLGMAYLLSKDQRFLDRLGEELMAVSAFTDWNPKHFLDVAEMSLAVAIGLDWAGGALPQTIIAPARRALLTKGLQPSLAVASWWLQGTNNWNQVCHGGTIAAALVLADEHPDAATKALQRALEGMPHALRTYAPDGIYPEGSSYWAYGTGYSVITVELLRTAFGTDFGLSQSPGFLSSGLFHKLNRAPSGDFYNFGDSRADAGRGGSDFLAWFALENKDGRLYNPEEIPREFSNQDKVSRAAALALPWLARLGEYPEAPLPTLFSGRGLTPLSIMRNRNDPSFFLGTKGGRAAMSHGNMDAGSFIFERSGIRWAVDLGMQSYHQLESLDGFNLWNREQQSDRWTLISKNSFNHNTLNVNDSLHRVEGFGRLEYATPDSTGFDLTELFGGDVDHVQRTFLKGPGSSFEVIDRVKTNKHTKKISWHMLTRAQISLSPDGAMLRQDGKSLRIKVHSPAGITFSVISLDPPPLEYDMRIPHLKRLELNIPEYLITEDLLIRINFGE
ncbi:MAG: heparinase II/III family protein [Bacteroidota bacterium]